MNVLKSGLPAIALALLFAGCATLEYSSPGMLDDVSVKGIEGKKADCQVVISTTGYYMLWTIPLVSGDIRWNPETKSINGGYSFFRDHVSLDELQTALLKIAESQDCELADVHYADTDSTFAGVSESGAIGALFGSSQMGVSALLVPRKQAK